MTIKRTLLTLTAGLLIALAGGAVFGQSAPQEGRIDDSQPFVEVPVVIGEQDGGATILAEMDTTSGDLDPLLYLVDANGGIIAENDDRSSSDLNATIRYVQATPGEYRVIATRFGVITGESSGSYTLNVETLPPETAGQTAAPDYALDDAALTAAGFPEPAPHPRAEWTILAYYGGDTDLEASVMNDLNEFEMGGGSTEDVRVLALLDRSPQFTTANGNWKTARLFEVGPDVSGDHAEREIATIDTEPLADLGRIDTGSGEALAQFLTWGMRNYPAERYAVSFASHGGGWRGVIADDSGLYSLMSVPQVQAAFAATREATGVESFDLLVNDACSMGSVEYHSAIAPYFDVSIASPEVVVNPALDMSLLLETLRQTPDRPLQDVGRALIDRYIDEDTSGRSGANRAFLTHAVLNLDGVDPVVKALNAFAEVVIAEPFKYSNTLGQARANTYTYSAFIGDTTTVDLGDLMNQVIANAGDPALVEAARDVLEAIGDARLYGRAAEGARPYTSHYSVYFPSESRDFRRDYLEDSPLKPWGRMLRSYFNASTPRLWAIEDSLATYHPPITPEVTVTRVFPQVSSVAFPPTISVEVVGRSISSGALTIDRVADDGTVYRMVETPILTEVVEDETVSLVNDWRSGVDQGVFNWLPLELPVVSDGTTESNEFLRQTGSTAALNGRYRATESDSWTDVSVIFNADGTVQDVISRRGIQGSLASIDIPTGATFQAYRNRVTADGQLQRESGTTYTWPAHGLTWEQRPTRSGTYNLGFLVTAYGGVTGFDTVTIEVDNDDYDATLQGYSDINLGINYQRPADWSPVVDLGNQLNTQSPAGDAEINVYYFSAQDNVFDIRDEVQRRYGFAVQGYSAYYRGHDDLALTFDHAYTRADGSRWQGKAVVFHRETAQGGRGIVFSVEALDGSAQADTLADSFDTLLSSINFFDAERLADLDAADWRYDFLDRRIPYPVRVRWRMETRDGWTIHRPPEFSAAADTRMAAVARLDESAPDVALNRILRDDVLMNPDDAEHRTYRGEYHTWESASYTTQYGGVRLAGRVYTTELNGRVYAMRFETPDNALASEMFRHTFEPMLDGFAPPSNTDYASGQRAAYVKAALVTADDICGDMDWNQMCFSGEDAESMRAIYLEGRQLVSREVSDTVGIDDLFALQVGVLPDGTIDPFSVAVLKLKANLPENEEGGVKLIFFGGTTVFNRGLLPPELRPSLPMVTYDDIPAERVNMRRLPVQDAYINGAFAAGQVVEAVARSPDNQWLRVRVPNDSARTGWVYRYLLVPADERENYFAFEDLPIDNPSRPHFDSMQAVEVFLMGDADAGETLNGMLIQTDPTRETANLEINDAVFQMTGGSVFFWRGSLGDVERVSAAEQQDVFDDTLSRRRPSAWESEVLSGSVRVQLAETGSRTALPTTVTSVAGTSIQYDESGDRESLNLNEASGALNSALTEGVGESVLAGRLNQQELDRLLQDQDQVNALDLATGSDLALYFADEGITASDTLDVSGESLFDYLFGAGQDDE